MRGSQTNEKTLWFPSTIKPVRKGFYESHWLIGTQTRLRYWDGVRVRENHSDACGGRWRFVHTVLPENPQA